MGFVSLDENKVRFTDGRHRVSWLRDRGVTALPLQVPPGQAREFERRFGRDPAIHLARGARSRDEYRSVNRAFY